MSTTKATKDAQPDGHPAQKKAAPSTAGAP